MQIEPKGFALVEKWITDRRTLWGAPLCRLGALLAEPEEK